MFFDKKVHNQPVHGCANKLTWAVALVLLGASQQTYAHIEYFDLNQGEHISDLTATGITASNAQYGLNTNTPTSLPSNMTLNQNSDRALNTTAYWNDTYQAYIPATAGQYFSNTQASTASGYAGATFFTSNTVNVDDITSTGWGNGSWGTTTVPGSTGVLADTHKVDFFNFRLTQDADVTITFNVDDGVGDYVENAFSLYKGVAAYQAHDDGGEKLQPKNGLTKVQDPLDTGSVSDAQGIASIYRQTAGAGTPTYNGQFDALHNWGDANASGNWSNIQYITSAHSKLGATGADGFSLNAADTLETLVIHLTAGNYTIAASGAINSSFGNASTDLGTGLHGMLTYSAVTPAAVPLPSAVWLFASALLPMLAGRKKSV